VLINTISLKAELGLKMELWQKHWKFVYEVTNTSQQKSETHFYKYFTLSIWACTP